MRHYTHTESLINTVLLLLLFIAFFSFSLSVHCKFLLPFLSVTLMRSPFPSPSLLPPLPYLVFHEFLFHRSCMTPTRSPVPCTPDYPFCSPSLQAKERSEACRAVFLSSFPCCRRPRCCESLRGGKESVEEEVRAVTQACVLVMCGGG